MPGLLEKGLDLVAPLLSVYWVVRLPVVDKLLQLGQRTVGVRLLVAVVPRGDFDWFTHKSLHPLLHIEGEPLLVTLIVA